MVNGVCQVAAYENSLLGFSSRLYPLIRPLLKSKDKAGKDKDKERERERDVEDVLCFGHLIFEMAMGFELDVCRPDIDQLVGKCPVDVIEVRRMFSTSIHTHSLADMHTFIHSDKRA